MPGMEASMQTAQVVQWRRLILATAQALRRHSLTTVRTRSFCIGYPLVN